MVDNNASTYTEFSYVEEYDNDGVIKENTVTVDIFGDRSFKADSFTISLDEHIARPTYVRVMTVSSGGEERILLAEQRMMSNHVTFPNGISDHFRITFSYIKPLRINEIVFYEENVPHTIQKFIRFIAQPDEGYNVYFNGAKWININFGEMPNLHNVTKKEIVQPEDAIRNTTYKKMDSDGDGVTDDMDNCVNVANEDQEDKDLNRLGDACEDFDRDGVINSRDNCPNDTNRNQRDTDGDGVGDVCDGEESRFTEKHVWLPWAGMGFAGTIIIGLFVITIKGMHKKEDKSTPVQESVALENNLEQHVLDQQTDPSEDIPKP